MKVGTLSRPFHFVKEYETLMTKGTRTNAVTRSTAGTVSQRKPQASMRWRRVSRLGMSTSVSWNGQGSNREPAGAPRSEPGEMAKGRYCAAAFAYAESRASSVCWRLVCPVT